ncbi:hypothetical protein CR513_56707, partial [Mucuna pruriens]
MVSANKLYTCVYPGTHVVIRSDLGGRLPQHRGRRIKKEQELVEILRLEIEFNFLELVTKKQLNLVPPTPPLMVRSIQRVIVQPPQFSNFALLTQYFSANKAQD